MQELRHDNPSRLIRPPHADERAAAKARHIVGIDVIRLVAAILVMFFHYGWVDAYPDALARMVSTGEIAFPDRYGWTKSGWIGVEIFFVISGFVIAFTAEKAASAYAFFVTRVVRLLPTALVCASITLIAAFTLQYSGYAELLLAYLRSVLFIPFNGYIDPSYWTLDIEVAFYALVFVLIAIGRYRWIKPLAIALGLQSTLFWLLYGVAASSPDGALFQQLRQLQDSRVTELLLWQHGCFFALGIFLWAHLTKQASRANVLWCLLFVAIGCLQIYGVTLMHYYRYGLMQSATIPILLWLLSLAAIILAVVFNERVHRLPQRLIGALRTMGLMTYPLYLLHQIVGLALMSGMVKLGVNPNAILLCTIVLIFAAAWLVCRVFEPPLQKIARNILLGFKTARKPAWADAR